MHIALVTPGWPPERCSNGIVTYVAHLRAELQRRGHRVSLLAVERGIDDRARGVLHAAPSRFAAFMRRLAGVTLPPPFDWGEAIADSLLRLHRRDPLDIVEMEESFGWCAQVQRRLPCPLVVKLHGPACLSLVEEERDDEQARLRLELEAAALRSARFVTSPSAITLQQTREHCALASGEHHVAPNPIVAPPGLELWRAASADPQQLLFVGRFDRRKGADFLLRAFARLHDLRPGLRLLFVGPDVGIDGVGIEDWLARELTPAARSAVRWLGRLPASRIARLRCESALTLVCSRWDNQPNTALEAMLQACPLVATDSGSMREVVQHGRTGLLYRSGDADDFCAQVTQMLDDRLHAERLGVQARAHVLAAHAPKAVGERTLDLYRRFVRLHALAPAAERAVTGDVR